METAAAERENEPSRAIRRALLFLNCLVLTIGNTGGPLLLRLYFLRGGRRKWFSGWLQTGGWPAVFLLLLLSYIHRRKSEPGTAKAFFITPRLLLASAGLGLLTGLDDFMYAYGTAYLPVSTSALLISTQLMFTAVFAFLIVRQRFTSFSVNAVFLLTVGAIVLGVHTKGDRPTGETHAKYMVGFFMTLGAAVLYGAVLPLIDLVYRKAKQAVTYTLVMEIQMVMSFFATAFCTLGMIVNNDFQAISREASEYELGPARYYVVVVTCAIMWQFFFVGMVGVISYSSSLYAGVIIAAAIPVAEVAAVLFFHEKFSAEKGISLALSLWGFASYLLGERKVMEKEKQKEKDNTIVKESELA